VFRSTERSEVEVFFPKFLQGVVPAVNVVSEDTRRSKKWLREVEGIEMEIAVVPVAEAEA